MYSSCQTKEFQDDLRETDANAPAAAFRNKRSKQMKSMERQTYSSRILKGGAILNETKILLANWNESLSKHDNLDRFRRNNILGKASRSRVEDIFQVFRQRYLVEEPVTKALVGLIRARYEADAFDRILYFHATRSDPLIHDFVIEVLWPRYLRGRQDILVKDAEGWIREKIAMGATIRQWSDNTIEKSARGLMSTLRDFGVLQGLNNKRTAPAYLPIGAFSYVAFYLNRLQPSGKRLLEDQEWSLFFLSPQTVERLFMEAHQLHLLEYHAAGSVIRVDFSAETLEEYIHVILERAH